MARQKNLVAGAWWAAQPKRIERRHGVLVIVTEPPIGGVTVIEPAGRNRKERRVNARKLKGKI